MKNKYTSIGGQALIEGVMMRSGRQVSMAVRRSDGEIEMKEQTLGTQLGFWGKIPFVRGIAVLISSMTVGIKALTWSASFFEEDSEGQEESKWEQWLKKTFGDHAENIAMGFSMVFAVGMAFLLFGALPTLIISFLKTWVDSQVTLSVLEGVLKMGMFISYVAIISKMKDIHRVFQYHGAEHKSIYCYESGKALTVENARKFTRLHPRCGTSFLVIVLLISIAIFSFLSWSAPWARIGMKLMFFPIIAGLSFEIIKLAGKYDNGFIRIITWPGLMMQKLTTKEPDDSQLEVALCALNAVLSEKDPLKRTSQEEKS